MGPSEILKGAEKFVNKIKDRLSTKDIFKFSDISEVIEIPGKTSLPLYMQETCRYIRVVAVNPQKATLVGIVHLGHGIIEVTNKSSHPIRIKIQGRNDE